MVKRARTNAYKSRVFLQWDQIHSMCAQRYECAEPTNLGILRQEKARQVLGFMLARDEISIYQTDFQGSCPSYQLSIYHRAGSLKSSQSWTTWKPCKDSQCSWSPSWILNTLLHRYSVLRILTQLILHAATVAQPMCWYKRWMCPGQWFQRTNLRNLIKQNPVNVKGICSGKLLDFKVFKRHHEDCE